MCRDIFRALWESTLFYEMMVDDEARVRSVDKRC